MEMSRTSSSGSERSALKEKEEKKKRYDEVETKKKIKFPKHEPSKSDLLIKTIMESRRNKDSFRPRLLQKVEF